MFFIGIFGVDNTAKPLGEANARRCPACGRAARMHLVKRYSYFHVFFIPTVKWDKQYLATCPCCASVMGLSDQVGRRVEQGEAPALEEGDLTLLRDNSVGLCPGCGAHNPPGSSYCCRCGRAL